MRRIIESILAKVMKICAELYYRLGHKTLIALSLNTKYDDHDFVLRVERFEEEKLKGVLAKEIGCKPEDIKRIIK